MRFKSEPTLSEVSNKLEEQALRLRFSTESATRLEIARVLVHLAGHTYRLAGVPLVEPPYNLTMPAIELAGEWPGEGGREGAREIIQVPVSRRIQARDRGRPADSVSDQ